MQIERTMVMKAARSRVWKALTNVTELSRWFGVQIEGEPAPGNTLQMVTTHPDYAGIRFPVFVEAVQPETSFSWRWFPGGENPERTDNQQTTLVTFTLEDVLGGTRVTVTETGFDRVKLQHRAKAFEDNVGGWHVQMQNLANHVEA